jgi:hypothetical protein
MPSFDIPKPNGFNAIGQALRAMVSQLGQGYHCHLLDRWYDLGQSVVSNTANS